MPQEEKPIAYDTQGRPLYLHPSQETPTEPVQNGVSNDGMQVVQVTRSTDPVSVTVSTEMQKRHEQSRQQYPSLNLSDGEYVIVNLQRHFIGLVSIWAVIALLALIIVVGWFLLLIHPGADKGFIGPSSVVPASSVVLGLLVLTMVIGWIALTIYKGNKFFLTSESVIQKIQTSLFSKKEQTINLENIKDASLDQEGILQNIFNYGTIKLSTEGSVEAYIFSIVSRPKHQIAIINNVVEAVKYGRPIEEALDNLPKD